MANAFIILAAGQGKRMNSDLPKVLHKVAGAPLLAHALRACNRTEPERTVIVTGVGADEVERVARSYDESALFVRQPEQLGTGHAVALAMQALTDFSGKVVVLFGDTPFIRPETLLCMTGTDASVTVLGFEAEPTTQYGRIVMTGGQLERIIEYKDASDTERAITLMNSGVLCAESALLADLVAGLDDDNAAREFYLTDVVGAAVRRGHAARVVICAREETLGVNSRADLAAAECAFQAEARAAALENGVTLTAPHTVFFGFDTVVGRDAIIGPQVIFGPGVTIESGAEIKGFCHLEGCHVSNGASVGPFARLRPGAELAGDVHVGNFVEIKNAVLDEGVKVGHLSYIGDAHIGAAANIGAGTVTCNFDGVMKHRTEIGAGAFIGSDTMLVAPVRVGDHAMTGSGSVITEDVADGALALARARQVNKPGMARKLFELFKAQKEKRRKELS